MDDSFLVGTLGRASVFPAEATWSDKAAELSADYLSYGPFGRSAMENGTLEHVNHTYTPSLSNTNQVCMHQRSRIMIFH